MKKQFVYLLILALLAGKQDYAQQTVSPERKRVIHAVSPNAILLRTVQATTPAGQIIPTWWEVSFQNKVAKKIAGTAPDNHTLSHVFQDFPDYNAPLRLTNSSSRYLEFIFPFYCFW